MEACDVTVCDVIRWLQQQEWFNIVIKQTSIINTVRLSVCLSAHRNTWTA